MVDFRAHSCIGRQAEFSDILLDHDSSKIPMINPKYNYFSTF